MFRDSEDWIFFFKCVSVFFFSLVQKCFYFKPEFSFYLFLFLQFVRQSCTIRGNFLLCSRDFGLCSSNRYLRRLLMWFHLLLLLLAGMKEEREEGKKDGELDDPEWFEDEKKFQQVWNEASTFIRRNACDQKLEQTLTVWVCRLIKTAQSIIS